MLAEAEAVERRAIRVRGAVQGVGFRPFVYRVATGLGLSGSVRNDADGVLIEVQGAPATLARFERRLRDEAPPLARIDSVESAPRTALGHERGFVIGDSRAGRVTTAIPPDAATCDECLAELFDPADRRHRYAFVNCTNCGPRYTLTRSLPYDRAMTSMATFALCPACRREYHDPASRRFHAEPNACPVCGPTLALVDASGAPIAGDAIAATIALLRAGRIVAIKGLGGFHLACDARDAAAVAALRARKQRDEKPFAVMARDVDAARQWVHVDAAAQALLVSPARPIVLLPLRADRPDALDGVAPGLDRLGVMLPCTPIQFLLSYEAPDLLLVMTSANPGGEPIVVGNDEARQRLGGIADALLMHDRDIVARCDDSVVRVTSRGAPQFVRRARGYTPLPVRLPHAGPPVLATGGWLKNTVCLTRGDEAFLSPHVGDLDNAATCRALVETVEHLCRVLDVQPQAVAHDLHPDFFSTRFAAEFAAARGLPTFGVQHHHAHVAAVAAEHRHAGPLLGLALDGVGLGADGHAWGGELLRVDGADFERLGHVAPIALPGGDVAAREPWRLAAAVLHRLGRGAQIVTRFGAQPAAAAVAQMLERGVRCPATTSLGRWFDAAAALLGVRATSAFEGQAPMQLEALAAAAPVLADAALWELVTLGADGVLDPTPLLARLADLPATPEAAAHGAALFHQALADGLARWAAQAAAATGLRHVALAGGCFLNALLTALLVPRLEAAGLSVLEARQAPPNDGGLALGQAWVAIARITAGG
ncbi:carbamoyltransferase HypF [Azohydromonas sediminis]|uniref:carbamoyltransferase HypF n=1 Tax=Azohydromonas sediminis TaxID=2259674 RepID=UPI000E65619A|nr:carbamoyltransferase HypF [Azohydromonas sediminis]